MHCLSVNARTQEMLALHWENFKRCWCISGTRILPADQTWQLCKTNPRASFKNFKSRVFPSRLMRHFTIMLNFAWAQLWSLFAPFKFQSSTHQQPRASISMGRAARLQQPQWDFTLMSHEEFRSFANHQLDFLSKPTYAFPQHHLPPHTRACQVDLNDGGLLFCSYFREFNDFLGGGSWAKWTRQASLKIMIMEGGGQKKNAIVLKFSHTFCVLLPVHLAAFHFQRRDKNTH